MIACRFLLPSDHWFVRLSPARRRAAASRVKILEAPLKLPSTFEFTSDSASAAAMDLFQAIFEFFAFLFQAIWYSISACVGLVSLVRVWGVCNLCNHGGGDWIEVRDSQLAWYNFGALILDCITFPLGIVALAVPWRLPFVLSQYFDAFSSSSNFELNIAYSTQFFFSVVDLITVPLGLFSLCVPWRTVPAGRAFIEQSDTTEKNWNSDLRVSFALQAILSFGDLLVAPFAIITFCSVIRTHPLCVAVLDASTDERSHYSADARMHVMVQFLRLLVDLLMLPATLVVAITGFRLPALVSIFRTQEGLERQLAVVLQFLLVLWDIPHLVLLLIMTATGFRVRSLAASGCFASVALDDDTRSKIRIHFLCWLLNWIYFALSLLLFGTLGRVPSFTRRLSSIYGADTFLDVELPAAVFHELYQFALDLAFLCLFALTLAIHPVRGLVSIVLLLEPLPKWKLRLASKAVDLLALTDAKSVEYAAAVRDTACVLIKESATSSHVVSKLAEQTSPSSDLGRLTLKDWSLFYSVIPDLVEGYAEDLAVADASQLPQQGEAHSVSVPSTESEMVAMSGATCAIGDAETTELPPTIAISCAQPSTELVDTTLPAVLQARTPIEVRAEPWALASDDEWSPPPVFAQRVEFMQRSEQVRVALEFQRVQTAVALRDGKNMTESLFLLKRLDHMSSRLASRMEQTHALLRLEQAQIGVDLAAVPGSFSPANVYHRSTSECRTIISSTTIGALVDYVALVGFLLNLALVYRALDMIRGIRRATIWDHTRMAIINTAVDYWLDLFALMGLVLLTVTVWPAIAVYTELAEYVGGGDLAHKPTIYGARKLIARHVMQLCSDVAEAASFLVHCDFVYVFTATAFTGVLAPIPVLLHSANTIAGDRDTDFHIDMECPTCCCSRFCCTLYVFVALLTLPLVLVCNVIPNNTHLIPVVVALNATGSSFINTTSNATSNTLETVVINTTPIKNIVIAFLILLFVCSLVGIVAASTSDQQSSITRPSRFVRFNYQNVLAIGSVLLDGFQLCSIPVTLYPVLMSSATSSSSSSSSSSSAVDDTLSGSVLAWFGTLAKNVLLFQAHHFSIVFWVSFGLVCAWFWVVSLPLGTRLVHGSSESQSILRSKTYRVLVNFFATVLFLPIIVNLLKALQCGTDNRLIANSEIMCWQSAHKGVALAAMLALFYFATTTQVFSTAVLDSGSGGGDGVDRSSASDADSLDVKFAPAYISFLNAQKLAITVALTLFAETPVAVLVICILVAVALIAYTLLFSRITGAPGACCIPAVSAMRIGTFVALLYAASWSLSAQSSPSPSHGLALLIGMCVIAALTLVAVVYHLRAARLSDDELATLAKLRSHVLRTHAALDTMHAFDESPLAAQAAAFHQLVDACTTPADLAACVCTLEASIVYYRLSATHYAHRDAWLETLRSEARSRVPSLARAIVALARRVRSDAVALHDITRERAHAVLEPTFSMAAFCQDVNITRGRVEQRTMMQCLASVDLFVLDRGGGGASLDDVDVDLDRLSVGELPLASQPRNCRGGCGFYGGITGYCTQCAKLRACQEREANEHAVAASVVENASVAAPLPDLLAPPRADRMEERDGGTASVTESL